MTRVVVLVPGPPGDESWVDQAVVAAESLDGFDVEVVVGQPDALPDADVVLGHGIQYQELARQAPASTKVLLSDRPVDLLGLEHVTVVDWSWFEAAYVAGAVAAAVTDEAVGLVCGPAVRTQRRVASAFTAGVEQAGRSTSTTVVHLSSFSDVPGGRDAGRRLADDLGCRVLLMSADHAGDAAGEEARARGVQTLGFLHPHPDDLGHVRSEISGVLADLLTRAAKGEDLPPVVHANLASGNLALELRDDAPAAAVAARDAATAQVLATPGLLD